MALSGLPPGPPRFPTKNRRAAQCDIALSALATETAGTRNPRSSGRWAWRIEGGTPNKLNMPRKRRQTVVPTVASLQESVV